MLLPERIIRPKGLSQAKTLDLALFWVGILGLVATIVSLAVPGIEHLLLGTAVTGIGLTAFISVGINTAKLASKKSTDIALLHLRLKKNVDLLFFSSSLVLSVIANLLIPLRHSLPVVPISVAKPLAAVPLAFRS